MNKSYIPTKTKIAAWIMMVIGGIGIIGGLLMAIVACRQDTAEIDMAYSFLGAVVFYPGLLYFLSGRLLFSRTRGAWILSVGILCVKMMLLLLLLPKVYSLREGIYHLLLASVFIPFILVILDKKAYWEIILR